MVRRKDLDHAVVVGGSIAGIPLRRQGVHAVVVGGSIAGMLSARVLIDSFEKVTLIETDQLPEKPDIRKGVPQSA